jgi:hypothetical protein
MTATSPGRPRARPGSLGDLLAIIGATGLALVSGDEGRDLALTRTVLFDPRGGVERTPGGMLLAVGVSVADPAAGRMLATAAASGFSAVVVKAYQEDVGPLARAADAHGLALLVVHDDVEWLSLDSHVNNALASASQGGDSVSSVAVGDLFSLAEAIADTVGGATAIEDFSQRILAYSSRNDHPIDDERRDGILGRQVPDLPENAEQYRRLYRSAGVLRFPRSRDGFARVAVAVRAGSELLGSIWVVDHDEALDARAEEALLGAASVAALHLLRARSSADLARQQRSEAARRLLDRTGDPVDAAVTLGLETGGPFAVLAFAPVRLDDSLATVTERLLPMVSLRCDARLGGTGMVLLDGIVYVVAAGPRMRGTAALAGLAAEVVAAVESSLRLRLLCGIGPVVRRPARVGAAREEAARVLALLRLRPGLGPVATWEQVSDQLALAALAEVIAQDERLVPLRARAILGHDQQHGTTYAPLLVAHLDNARDITRTADRLAVHPNTVRYRLRRAAELFDLDLADTDQVLPLWLALRSLLAEPPGGD